MYLSRDRLTWRELMKTDRWFVVVVSLLLLVGCVSLIMLPRVWRVSPAGFFPVFRVNGLSLVRERFAIRAAEAAEIRGDLPQALEEWRRAMSANPAAVPSKRRYLQMSVLRGAADLDPDGIHLQIRQSALLLRLTGTNQADLELSAAVAHAVELEDYTVKTLAARPLMSLTSAGRGILAGAYFQLDEFAEFRRIALADPGLTNTWFARQRAAVDLILGEVPPATGWSPLETHETDPQQALFVARLRMVAAAWLGDEGRFNQAWAVVEQAHALRARDHVRRWQLLTRMGRLAEATTTALAFEIPPLTPLEAIQVVRELDRVGLTTKAIRYGETALEKHRSDPLLWRETGRLMVRAAAPEILIRFAANLRLVEWDEEPQIGLASYYLGVAEHRLGHTVRADDAFGEAASDPALRSLPISALECADVMRQSGYADRAERIIQAVQIQQGNVSDFWARVQQAARTARSEGWLWDAARREYLLNPSAPAVQKRYLEALLLNRTNTVDALALATRLQQARPNDPVQTLALARAQALSQQWANAEQTLASVNEGQLALSDLETVSRFHLTRGEVLVELQRRREAAVVLAKVETNHLFPDELQRYQLLRERAR